MVGICANIVTLTVGDGGNITPFVVGVTCCEIAILVGDAYNVILCVAYIVILLVVVTKRIDIAIRICIETELGSVASAAENENTSVVIVELGSNTVDGLGDSLSACIIAVGDAPSKILLLETEGELLCFYCGNNSILRHLGFKYKHFNCLMLSGNIKIAKREHLMISKTFRVIRRQTNIAPPTIINDTSIRKTFYV